MNILGSSRRRSLIFIAALLASLGFSGTAAAEEPRLYLVDVINRTAKLLPDPPSRLDQSIASASAINDAGQVIGNFQPGFGYGSGFVTGPDGVGIQELLDAVLNVSDINNAGQVVGASGDPFSPRSVTAFIRSPDGVLKDLGTLGGTYSGASGINDAGQVAGSSDITGDSAYHIFITGTDGAGMRDLGTLGGGSAAAAGINNAGQVVGYSETSGGDYHAFITGPDGTGMRDLGTLGAGRSEARAINDIGEVVGSLAYNPPGGPYHAFITGPDGKDMRMLGTLGGTYSDALDINNAGQVVGWSDTAEGGHAFITGSHGSGMTDLNSLVDLPQGLVLTDAMAINNSGQVVALAGPPPVIPEPETYALMLAGLGLIGLMVRRKKVEIFIKRC
jgi:probable HAF family extracellular repeat protein